MSEDTEPNTSKNIRLYWLQSQTIPGLWLAHAGCLTAAVAPSIEYPGMQYWRVHPDGCDNNIATDTAVDLDDAMLAAEDAIRRAAYEVLAAFVPSAES